MGKGGGHSSPDPYYIQPPPANIPNEQNLMAAATWRTMAGVPWWSSPWRGMDFLFGLPAPTMQVPQFQPPPGVAIFNPQHGGGYGSGQPTTPMEWYPPPIQFPPPLNYMPTTNPPRQGGGSSGSINRKQSVGKSSTSSSTKKTNPTK